MMGAPVDAFDDGIGRCPSARHAGRARPAGRAPARPAHRHAGRSRTRQARGRRRVIARCMVLMMSPRMERSRSVCSRPGFKVQRAGPICSASPSRSSLAARPSISRRSSGSSSGAAGPQIGDAAAVVGDVAQRAIEAGPALGLDLLLQGGADFLLAARPQLQGDALGGAAAKPPADVVAADDQVLAVIGAAADQDMDVRIVGVPVIDRHPVELGAEIASRRRSSARA